MSKQRNREETDIIREVFSYIQKYRDKTFVFKIDHTVVDDPVFPTLLRDLAILHKSGIRVVIVPGAKERIDEVLRKYGFDWEIKNGIRIATEETIPFVKMAAFDVSNKIMSGLAGNDTGAVIGNWVVAKSLGVVDGMDYQNSGMVERIKIDSLRRVLEDSFIPIFPNIGWNALGKSYNLLSDELALNVGLALQADKLFFISSEDELKAVNFDCPEKAGLSSDGRISQLTVDDAQQLLSRNGENREPLGRIELGVKACRLGISRVHIVNGRVEGVVLKEIFSNLGAGTMIYTNQYEKIREMQPSDVTDVLRIMEPYIGDKILIIRDENTLKQQYRDFIVYDVDGTVHGCAALHVHGEGQGEIAAVTVDQAFSRLGIGKRLVLFLVERGRETGLKRVFALTTQSSDWFEKLGFYRGDILMMPEKKRKDYNVSRNSRVMVYDL